MSYLKFEIKAGTYPYSICVIISEDMDRVVDYANRKHRRTDTHKYRKEDFENKYAAFCFDEEYEPIIWMPCKPETALQLCSVAHEILHAVFECMNWYGITLHKSSEEAFTCLHTHLMQQFLNKCGMK